MSATVNPDEWEKLEKFMAAARVAVPKEGDEIFGMMKGMADGAEVNLYKKVFKNK